MAHSQDIWPAAKVRAFTLRMSDHGFSVSPTLMRYDRRYALEQLQYAHTLADDHLRELAMALFRNFERRMSGIAQVA